MGDGVGELLAGAAGEGRVVEGERRIGHGCSCRASEEDGGVVVRYKRVDLVGLDLSSGQDPQ